MVRHVLLVRSAMNALKLDLPLLLKKKTGPSAGLSRSVGTPTPRKANAEPGRLTLASVKRSCPCAPAYCKDATVFRAISRSSATVQKVILGASRRLSMPRTKKPGNVGAAAVPSGPKLLGTVAPALISGIVATPDAPVVPATNVGMPKLNL